MPTIFPFVSIGVSLLTFLARACETAPLGELEYASSSESTFILWNVFCGRSTMYGCPSAIMLGCLLFLLCKGFRCGVLDNLVESSLGLCLKLDRRG